MARTAVGILRGGTSSEYDLSLKTGAVMLGALPEDRYDMRDIFVDKRGYWHLRGIPADPSRILSQLDVVLNALHGGIGEGLQENLDDPSLRGMVDRRHPVGVSLFGQVGLREFPVTAHQDRSGRLGRPDRDGEELGRVGHTFCLCRGSRIGPLAGGNWNWDNWSALTQRQPEHSRACGSPERIRHR